MLCHDNAKGADGWHQTDKQYKEEASLYNPKGKREDAPSLPIKISWEKRDDRDGDASPSTPVEWE
jgi:hypothetical protein